MKRFFDTHKFPTRVVTFLCSFLILFSVHVYAKDPKKRLDLTNPQGVKGLYLGSTSEGNAEGQGKVYWFDGGSYSGSFSGGQMHGEGVYIYPDRTKYDGPFIEGFKEGHGEYTWPDGRRYLGNFQKDQRHGRGVFTFPD